MKEIILKARCDETVRLDLIKSFEPLIKKCIKYYVKNPTYYNDAYQEGCMIILYCIKHYDINSNYPFEAYLKKSMLYAMKHFSRKIKECASLDESINEDGGCLYDIIDCGENVEEDNIKRDEIRKLRAELAKLTDGQRHVIECVYFKNMKLKELAKNRRCHYMTVVALKKRALQKLKEEMNK